MSYVYSSQTPMLHKTGNPVKKLNLIGPGGLQNREYTMPPAIPPPPPPPPTVRQPIFPETTSAEEGAGSTSTTGSTSFIKHAGVSLMDVPYAPSSQHFSPAFLLNRDYQNYRPLKIFPLKSKPLQIHSSKHELERDILALQYTSQISIYSLKIKDELVQKKIKNPIPTEDKEEEKEEDRPIVFEELQRITTREFLITSFALSPISSITYGPLRMTFAFSISMGLKFVTYLVDQDDETPIDANIDALSSHSFINNLGDSSSQISHLAFDGEEGKYLAAASEDPSIEVWDLKHHDIYNNKTEPIINKIVSFPLKASAASICWHKSEPQKLLVVEREGWIKMFNVAKRCQILSTMVFGPIHSADWQYSNPLNVGLGANNLAYLIDTSKLISNQIKLVEIKSGKIVGFKYSSSDAKMFAILGKPENEVRVYNQNHRQPLVCIRRKEIQDFCWIYGTNYFVVLMGKNLAIYSTNDLIG